MMVREVKGVHVLAGFAAMFGIIMAVNVTLAVNAVRTFPGLEVANSYVASQQFEARRQAQEALGWTVLSDYADGVLHVELIDAGGASAEAHDLTIHIGRPTMAKVDRSVPLDAAGDARLDLSPGRWRIDLTARAADGTRFSQALTLRVQP